MTRPAWIALAVALLGTGCQSDCYTLALNICECAPSQIQQQSCQSQIAVVNGTATPTGQDLARCTQFLNSCDCRMLETNTLAAKVACGLARPDPNDRAFHP
ncbi:MAG: hypothetical protein ACYCWW_21290 [Deltaproteobacteria bacterium]